MKIYWQDACTDLGWKSKDDSKNVSPVNCISVGILIHKSKEKVVIAMTDNTLGHTGDQFAIPRKCVTKIVPLVHRR